MNPHLTISVFQALLVKHGGLVGSTVALMAKARRFSVQVLALVFLCGVCVLRIIENYNYKMNLQCDLSSTDISVRVTIFSLLLETAINNNIILIHS